MSVVLFICSRAFVCPKTSVYLAINHSEATLLTRDELKQSERMAGEALSPLVSYLKAGGLNPAGCISFTNVPSKPSAFFLSFSRYIPNFYYITTHSVVGMSTWFISELGKVAGSDADHGSVACRPVQ